MKKILLLSCLGAIMLFADAQIKSIDIFNNMDFINQKLNTKQKSVDLLGVVKLENIKFVLPNSCRVNSYEVHIKSYEDDELSKKIDDLNEKINLNENKVKALNSSTKFLENSSLRAISDMKTLKQSSSFVEQQIEDNYNKIYKIENEIKLQEQNLNELIKKRANGKFTRLNYDIDCKKEVLLNYPITAFQKKSLFDINYNSKSKKLSFENTLFITQSLGQDLKGIDVNFYTFNYSDRIEPNIFVPEYLDLNKNKRVYAESVADMAVNLKSAKLSKAPTFAYMEGTTKSYFQAKNIDLISGKENKVILANDTYKGDNTIEIDGYSMSQAYYRVDFKTKKLYGNINANLYLDGLYIGKQRVNTIKKDEASYLYFGNSRLIEVKKELVKDIKEEPFFSMNRQKTQKIWDYTITNRSKVAEKITLLERVPVSKHEDIKVKLIGETTETKLKNNGKIYFDFELKPDESKKVNFGYEIDRPDK